VRLRFHVIYTPGTVKYLRLFVLSLLKWSECSYTLVSNGCSREENRMLEKFCEKSPRLEFLLFPSKKTADHGSVLSYLQKLEQSDHFCFMDSDIFATGDFLGDLMAPMDSHAAVFSGQPIWSRSGDFVWDGMPEGIEGSHVASGHEICLGCSYFAIYDNRKLSRFIGSTGIGFEKTRAWNKIPFAHRNELTRMGLKAKRYDTCKLLNILLQCQGEKLLYRDSRFLQHVGGLSRLVFYDQRRSFSGMIKLSRLVKRWVAPGTVKEPRARQRQRRRIKVCRYFSGLLESLFENHFFQDDPDVTEPRVRESVEAAAEKLRHLYEEFKTELA